ncbi:hypothetical protein Tco_0425146 [Tanacetum coccineum]
MCLVGPVGDPWDQRVRSQLIGKDLVSGLLVYELPLSRNRLTKKEITMADPEEYVSVTRKNFLSNDRKGRTVEKSFLKIQGTFLVKIRDNTFSVIIGENTFKHNDNFLEVVGPLKIKGLSQDRFRINIFPISLVGAASESFKKDYIGSVTTWENLVEKFIQKFYQLSDNKEEMETDEDDDPNDIADIFKIKGNLFDFETPLCKEIKTYEEYELNNNMIGDFEEPWSDNGVPYQPCDHICEHIVLRMESLNSLRVVQIFMGSVTGKNYPGCSFENFHELDYDVLVKLEECWWKVNAHENAPFARWENHGQVPYVNVKTEKDYEPYLDINRIFGRNYGSNNADNTQENKKEHNDPSICNIRRFEIIKYSFDADDEYVAIKEHEHFDHSKTNVDACQAYRELFNIVNEGWLMTKEKEG